MDRETNISFTELIKNLRGLAKTGLGRAEFLTDQMKQNGTDPESPAYIQRELADINSQTARRLEVLQSEQARKAYRIQNPRLRLSDDAIDALIASEDQ